jgi:LEA14-like dessication related protein
MSEQVAQHDPPGYERGSDGMIRQRMHDRTMAVRGVLLAAVLAFTGCVPFGQQFQSPEVTLETLRILRIADAKADVSISLRVFNPNTYTLPVDRVDFEVTLDGRPAANSHSIRVDPLPPLGEAKVELAGRVDIAAVATALMTIGSQLPVDYALKGTITLTDGTAVPVARKGRIPVARFDRSFGPRPQ